MSKKRILLVENDKQWHRVVRLALGKYDLHIASTYEEAKEKLKESPPYGLLIVDINLLDSSLVPNDRMGISLVKHLQDIEYQAPCILITADPESPVHRWSELYNVYDTLIKGSFNSKQLANIVEQHYPTRMEELPGQKSGQYQIEEKIGAGAMDTVFKAYQSRMEELPGQRLGQYQIEEKIGAGGMATVFKAYQSRLDRYVAVKVLDDKNKGPDFARRFELEAKAIARLQHPNILPVYDFGVERGYTYIVMRYVEGGLTLREVLMRQQTLDLKRAIDLASQIGQALAYAHKQGIIHRDVKPGNVLIDGEWAFLADFGIAKISKETTKLTKTGMIMGTPAYMSPEQLRAERVDHRSDIYALGVIFYQMLTGVIPHNADTPWAIVFNRSTEPPCSPCIANPAISKSIEQVTLRALATRLANRYDSAANFVTALRKAATDVSYQKPAIDNVYATLPITGKFFYGRRRRQLVDQAIASFNSYKPHSWILYGGKRMGKSSILYEIKERLSQPCSSRETCFIPVLVDLGKPTPSSRRYFFEVMAKNLRETIDEQKILPRAAELSPETGDEFSIFQTDREEERAFEEFEEYYNRLVSEIKAVYFETRIIFLIDEVDRLSEHDWGREIPANLRTLIQSPEFKYYKNTALVLAGTSKSLTKLLESGPSLENELNRAILETFSLEDTKQLTGIYPHGAIGDSVVEYLYDLTGGHPYILQYILQGLSENDVYPVTVEGLKLSGRQFVDNTPIFKNWAYSFSDLESKIYRTLAQSFTPLSRRQLRSERGVGEALDTLTSTGVIRKVEPVNYEISGLLFRDWLIR